MIIVIFWRDEEFFGRKLKDEMIIISLFHGEKTNIIVILRQNSETAQISHHTQQMYTVYETSRMRPYVDLSFRNDYHIVVNPSQVQTSNFMFKYLHSQCFLLRWT